MANTADSSLRFTHLPHPAPTDAAARAAVLANPGFGSHFSDHMVSIDWNEDARMPQSAHASRSRSIPPPPCCIMRRRSSRA
jgi:hypothetical protein